MVSVLSAAIDVEPKIKEGGSGRVALGRSRVPARAPGKTTFGHA
jgi:hypothetical protein